MSRHTLFDEKVGSFSIFVKRQENHNYRSLRHPFRGSPTFFRDLHYIRRMEEIGVPTVEPVFYGERREGGRLQAVLATIALEGYNTLNDLFQDPSLATSLRHDILCRLADTVRLIHSHHLQHDSLGGNHVMVKVEGDGEVDLRILDLEKMRRNFITANLTVRDLEKFVRHTPTLTTDEHAVFLLHYTRYFSHRRRGRLIKMINQRLLRSSLAKSRVVPMIRIANEGASG